MGLVRKRAWSGVYPWIAGEHVAPLFYSGYQAPPVPMGLGAVEDLPKDLAGMTIDCRKSLYWAVSPDCWKYSPSTWDQILNFTRPVDTSAIVPPPAVPLAYTKQSTYSDPDQFTSEVDAALAAGADATRASILGQTQQGASYLPDEGGSLGAINWPLWVGIGAGVLVLGVFLGGGSPRRYGR